MNCNMKGKTLVISGGTKGIGKECVYKFASNGVNVAFTYNSNGEVAEEICKDVESKFGVKCKAYPFNILEPEKYSELFEEIDKDFDRVDFFISNAMIYGRAVVGGYGKFMKLKPRGFKQYLYCNCKCFCLWSTTSSKKNAKSWRRSYCISIFNWKFGIY